MKTLGTDIILSTCKAEGYMMIQYDARKKFNRSTEYRFFCYYPEYCTEVSGELLTDVYYTFDQLERIYNGNKQAIDSFAETDQYVNFTTPDYYDFLNLASDINSYQGL